MQRDSYSSSRYTPSGTYSSYSTRTPSTPSYTSSSSYTPSSGRWANDTRGSRTTHCQTRTSTTDTKYSSGYTSAYSSSYPRTSLSSSSDSLRYNSTVSSYSSSTLPRTRDTTSNYTSRSSSSTYTTEPRPKTTDKVASTSSLTSVSRSSDQQRSVSSPRPSLTSLSRSSDQLRSKSTAPTMTSRANSTTSATNVETSRPRDNLLNRPFSPRSPQLPTSSGDDRKNYQRASKVPRNSEDASLIESLPSDLIMFIGRVLLLDRDEPSLISFSHTCYRIKSLNGNLVTSRKKRKFNSLCAERRYMDLFNWGKINRCFWSSDTKFCARAASRGSLGDVIWARSLGCGWDSTTSFNAAVGGHLEVLRWVLDNGCDFYPHTLYHVAKCGHLHVLNYAHETSWSLSKDEIFDGGVEGGHTGVFLWALRIFGPPNYYNLRRAAATGGHIDMLRLVEEKSEIDIFTNDVIQCAAKAGRLELLKWMVESQGVNLPGETCSWAAAGGHVNVIEWAIGHGCSWTQWALEEAQLHHQVSVLKWVEENGMRLGAGNTSSLNHAAISGNIELGTMARKSGQPWSKFVIPSATRNGHVKFVQWATDNGCPWDTQTIYKAAIRGGHLKMLKWIILDKKCRYDADEICKYAIETKNNAGDSDESDSDVTSSLADSLRVVRWVLDEELQGWWHLAGNFRKCAELAIAGGSIEMMVWLNDRVKNGSWGAENIEKMKLSVDPRIRKFAKCILQK